MYTPSRAYVDRSHCRLCHRFRGLTYSYPIVCQDNCLRVSREEMQTKIGRRWRDEKTARLCYSTLFAVCRRQYIYNESENFSFPRLSFLGLIIAVTDSLKEVKMYGKYLQLQIKKCNIIMINLSEEFCSSEFRL